MVDYPIIFSAPMIGALLAGRKTMTRRLVPYGSKWMRVLSGDRLWVREAHALLWPDEYPPEREQDYRVEYRANTNGKCMPGEWPDDKRDDPDCPKWRPSIHLPRWASRLTLIVTATKIEKVQEISETDVAAEGMRADLPEITKLTGRPNMTPITWNDGQDFTAHAAFKRLWSALHGPDSWTANPEVVALTFTVVTANIDTPPPSSPQPLGRGR